MLYNSIQGREIGGREEDAIILVQEDSPLSSRGLQSRRMTYRRHHMLKMNYCDQ